MNLFELQSQLNTSTATNVICNELVDSFAGATDADVRRALVDAITAVLFHGRSPHAPRWLQFRDDIRKAVVAKLRHALDHPGNDDTRKAQQLERRDPQRRR
jgi:hypothetical protein